MKKGIRFLTVVLIMTFIFGMFAITAYARDLEPCRLCGGKGDYHCVSCGNTGTVTCHGCGGSGTWVCQGEDGKGKCNKGYYTCPSCHGDTYLRTGDGEIPPDAQPGTCGACGGKGKIECWTCHGTGGGKCDKCNGTGKEECQVGTCKVSKQYGWKCPNCKGTGYILVGNPMPPMSDNDGVKNVPVKGDYIVTNDKTWAGYRYGGTSSGDKQTTSSDKQTTSSDKQTTSSDNQTASSDKQETDFPPADMTLLPENRNSDFEIAIPKDSERPAAAAVRVEMGKMTDSQQRYFAALPEEELAQVLTNVRQIVSSAQPGKSTGETDELLNAIASKNDYGSTKDAKILPLYFEGHQEVGFPVCVTVNIEKGTLDGGSDIYIYHIADDGTVEPLGKAEYSTYEDGTVQSVSFYTSSFSTFFTAANELDVDVRVSTDKPVEKPAGNDEKSTLPVVLCVIAAVIVAAGAVIAIVFIKKRKAQK